MNLIQLDSNTSFDLEDFDPLNRNAKRIPTVSVQKPFPLPSAAPGTSSSSRVQAFSNPVYPYYLPGQQQPSHSAATKTDDDVELLRKYGLDRFKLTDGNQKYFSCYQNNGGATTVESMANANIGNGNNIVKRTHEQFYPLNGNGPLYTNTNGGGRQQKQLTKKDPWTTFD